MAMSGVRVCHLLGSLLPGRLGLFCIYCSVLFWVAGVMWEEGNSPMNLTSWEASGLVIEDGVS